MARFTGKVRGSRGEVLRLGTNNSGLTTTCQGLNLGVVVEAQVQEVYARAQKDAMDVFTIDVNGGSGGRGGTLRLADIAADGVITIYNSKGETVAVLTDLLKS